MCTLLCWSLNETNSRSTEIERTELTNQRRGGQRGGNSVCQEKLNIGLLLFHSFFLLLSGLTSLVSSLALMCFDHSTEGGAAIVETGRLAVAVL